MKKQAQQVTVRQATEGQPPVVGLLLKDLLIRVAQASKGEAATKLKRGASLEIGLV